MKQNITKTQLNELSKEGKAKLRKWNIARQYREGDKTGKDYSVVSDLPLLSIGEMIEFLNIKPGDMIPVNNVEDSNEPCDSL